MKSSKAVIKKNLSSPFGDHLFFLRVYFRFICEEHRPTYLIKCLQQRLLGLQFALINHLF